MTPSITKPSQRRARSCVQAPSDLQIFDHRRPERLPSAVVKAAVVLGAFNDAVHNQTIAKKGSFVRAGPVAGVELLVFRLVDRVGLPVDDDGDHVVFINFLAPTALDKTL